MPGWFIEIGLRLRGARFLLVHEEGACRLAFGSAPAGLVRTAAEVLGGAAVERAWVAEVGGSGRRRRLAFSGNVPEPVRQRIRNAWTPPPGPDRSGPRQTG